MDAEPTCKRCSRHAGHADATVPAATGTGTPVYRQPVVTNQPLVTNQPVVAANEPVAYGQPVVTDQTVVSD